MLKIMQSTQRNEGCSHSVIHISKLENSLFTGEYINVRDTLSQPQESMGCKMKGTTTVVPSCQIKTNKHRKPSEAVRIDALTNRSINICKQRENY